MTAPAHRTRLLIVLNPTAGHANRRHIDAVRTALLRRGIDAQLYETRAPGDALQALPALATGYDVVVAAGGDGTVNEVLNGLRDSNALLGIIPCGTTNVLATELGLPYTPEDLAELLAAGTPRTIYSGEVNGRRFGMMNGIGYDARVVEGVDLDLKKKAGKLAYVLSMLRELRRFGKQRYRVEVDGQSYTATSIVCTLGRHYAGSYVLAREARIDEPALHLVLVQTLNRWAFLLMLLALPLGLAARLPFMRTVKGRQVRITALEGPPAAETLQADGDIVSALPAEIRVGERPLRVLAPPNG